MSQHETADHRAARYRLIDGRWQPVGAIELDEDEEAAAAEHLTIPTTRP